MYNTLKSMLWLLFSCLICISALWIISQQAELEHGVLDQLIPFTQGQKDSIHTTTGIAIQHEQYSGAEIMHSLRELAVQDIIVEVDGIKADLSGVESDDYAIRDAALNRASSQLDLMASYEVQIDYTAGHIRKISFLKK